MASTNRIRKTAGGKTRKPALRLPGEKAVKPTEKEVGVKPRRLSKAQRTAIPEPAVDHRRQVLDDEPRSGDRCPPVRPLGMSARGVKP